MISKKQFYQKNMISKKKKNEKNNVTIALNILYAKKGKIYPAYVSRNNSNHKKQVIFFNDSKWIGTQS